MQVPSLLDSSDALPHDIMPGMSHASLTLQLCVQYTGTTNLSDVVVSLSGPAGVQLEQVGQSAIQMLASPLYCRLMAV